MFYFLKNDLDIIDKEIEDLFGRLEKVGKELGESCKQSSETWHDNYPYEEAKRQAAVIEQRLKELAEIKKNSVLIKPEKTDLVSIGDSLTILDLETGTEKKIKIGSYISFEEGTVSYLSPLGNLLLNSEIGEIRKGIIGTKEKVYKIISIE